MPVSIAYMAMKLTHDRGAGHCEGWGTWQLIFGLTPK
jgi:hypothetical protein